MAHILSVAAVGREGPRGPLVNNRGRSPARSNFRVWAMALDEVQSTKVVCTKDFVHSIWTTQYTIHVPSVLLFSSGSAPKVVRRGN